MNLLKKITALFLVSIAMLPSLWADETIDNALVDIIYEASKIPSRKLGKIDCMAHSAFIDVPEKFAAKIIRGVNLPGEEPLVSLDDRPPKKGRKEDRAGAEENVEKGRKEKTAGSRTGRKKKERKETAAGNSISLMISEFKDQPLEKKEKSRKKSK